MVAGGAVHNLRVLQGKLPGVVCRIQVAANVSLVVDRAEEVVGRNLVGGIVRRAWGIGDVVVVEEVRWDGSIVVEEEVYEIVGRGMPWGCKGLPLMDGEDVVVSRSLEDRILWVGVVLCCR